MDLKSALGAELLTAEAAYALLSVDYRLVVDHGDGLRRADLIAFAASDTFAFFELGAGCHTGAEK